MSESTIDRLQIEIEAESKKAASSIDSFTAKLEKMQTVVGDLQVGKLSQLGNALRGLASVHVTGVTKEVEDLGTQIDKTVTVASRKLEKDLVSSFNIIGRESKQQVHAMIADMAELEKEGFKNGGEEPFMQLGKVMEELTTYVAQHVGDTERSLEDFYEYWRSLKPIYINEKIVGDLKSSGTWQTALHDYVGKFTTDINKMSHSLDTIYQEMNEKWPHLFPSSAITGTEQFEQLISALSSYRDMLNGVNNTTYDWGEALKDSQHAVIAGYDEVESKVNQLRNEQKAAAEEARTSSETASENQWDFSGLDSASASLKKLSASLKGMPTGDEFTTLSSGIRKLCSAAEKAEQIDRFAESLEKLSPIMRDMPASSRLSSLADGLKAFNTVDANNLALVGETISDPSFAAGFSYLGEAIRNFPSTKTLETLPDKFRNLASALSALYDIDVAQLAAVAQIVSGISTGTNGTSNIAALAVALKTLQTATDQTGATEGEVADGFQQIGAEAAEATPEIEGVADAIKDVNTTASASDPTLTGNGKAEEEVWTYSSEIETLLTKIREYKALIAGMESGKTAFDEEKYKEAVAQIAIMNEKLKDYKKDAVNAAKATEDIAEKSRIAAEEAERAARAAREAMNTAGGQSTPLLTGSLGFSGTMAKALYEMKRGVNEIPDVLDSAMGRITSTLSSLPSRIFSIGSAFVSASGKTAKFASSLLKVTTFGASVSKLKTRIASLGTAFESLNRKLKRTVRLFSMMALRKAFTAVFSELGTAIEHLAQKSDNFNEKISELQSSLKYLGHTVAAAAEPLLDIFGGALTTIIDGLATAISYMNQFLAALSGKSYYTAAKKVATDYAESLEDTSDAVNHTLQGFNELNNMTLGSDSSSSSDDDELEDCYETLEINEKILEIVAQIKEAVADMFAPMLESWEQNGEAVMTALQYALDSCTQAIADMGTTFMNVWTNGTGLETCNNILAIVEDIFNWVGDIATAWDNAWNTDGEAYIQSIFDKLNSILSLIDTISDSFAKVWNNGTGEVILSNILKILTNINNIVTGLVTSFKNAWNEAGVGTSIVQGIADIFTTIQEHVVNITDSLARWASDIDWEPLLTALDGLVDALEPLADTLGEGLEWLFENVLEPLADWAVESAIPAAIDLITGAVELLDSVIQAAEPALEWIWDNFLEPLANWTGSTIVGALEDFADTLGLISQYYNGDITWDELKLKVTFGVDYDTESAEAKQIQEIMDEVEKTEKGTPSQIAIVVAVAKVASWINDFMEWVNQETLTIEITFASQSTKFLNVLYELYKWATGSGSFESFMLAFGTWAVGTDSDSVSNTVSGSSGSGLNGYSNGNTGISTSDEWDELFKELFPELTEEFKLLTNAVNGTTTAFQFYSGSSDNDDSSSSGSSVFSKKIYSDLENTLANYSGSITVDTNLIKGTSFDSDAFTAITTADHSVSTASQLLKGTWSDMGYTAMTTANHTTTTASALAQASGSSWNKNGWTALTTSNHATTTTASLLQASGSSWSSNGWTALTKSNHTTTTSAALAQGSGTNWSSNGWTALTKTNHSTKTTAYLAQGSGTNWDSKGWTALTKTDHTTTTTTALQKGSWDGASYTAMTKADHTQTTKAKLQKNSSSTFNSEAYTALTKADHTTTTKAQLKKDTSSSGWNTDAWSVVKSAVSGAKLTMSVVLDFVGDAWESVKSAFGFAEGGYISSTGVHQFASGGIIGWNSIQKYGSGTSNAHGSLFVAGEAGAEIVGHVNGQTEVLNRSQLAEIMKNSVVTAFAQYIPVWNAIHTRLADCANAIITSQSVEANYVANTCVAAIPTASTIAKASIANSSAMSAQNSKEVQSIMESAIQNAIGTYVRRIADNTEDMDVNVQIGDKQLFNAVRKSAYEYYNRTGKSAFAQ